MTIAPTFDVRVTQGLQAYFKQPSGPSRAGTDWSVSLIGSEGEQQIIVRTYSDDIGKLSQDQEVQILLAYVGRLLQSGWLPEQYRGEPGELVASGGNQATTGEASHRQKRRSTFSIVRAGVIGAAAVALPSAAYGAAIVSVLRGVEEFLVCLVVALVLVGALAWTGVRVAGFSPRLAVVLTTIPFMLGTLLTVTALFSNAPAGFLVQVAILAAALGVAGGVSRLAKHEPAA